METDNEPSPFRFFWPALLIIAPPAVVGILWMLLIGISHDRMSLLWEREVGVKMLVFAFLLAGIGEVVVIALAAVRAFAMSAQTRPVWRILHTIAVMAAVFLFFAPGVFVMLVGPSVVQVQMELEE